MACTLRTAIGFPDSPQRNGSRNCDRTRQPAGRDFPGVAYLGWREADWPGSVAELSRAELPSSQVNWRARRPEFTRHPHQVGEGIRFHFLHDLPTVCFYCDFADTELAANLFIQQSRDD